MTPSYFDDALLNTCFYQLRHVLVPSKHTVLTEPRDHMFILLCSVDKTKITLLNPPIHNLPRVIRNHVLENSEGPFLQRQTDYE